MKITENEKGYMEITPDEGMYLYDGSTIASIVCVPKNNTEKWNEISSDEADKIKAEKEAAEEAAREEEKKLKVKS